MTANSDVPALTDLDFLPYLDADGQLPAELSGKIGAYAIFDRDRVLQFVGYSRDVFLSLKQHLARRPQQCYWVKAHAIARPSRQILDGARTAWLTENKTSPPGNGEEFELWTQAIDAKLHLSDEEREQLQRGDELTRMKLLKNAARRVEAEVKSALDARGARLEMRFNPKLKEQGLLDLK
ncbi:hypothetical protein KR51_00014880 [Rubidibacter lacunae KORDI 51-2]|uniref:Nuclease subunit of the excinuclease complex n=1 Tax=Rubidibacter lacunae KORDI 51-2 TaxID=582515 RepID=U5DQ52_9CHRO|nr:GIY-YIG nuclease family protein [Rubidibacter lacunae]ERN41825.1 hypothetical protein KR51_00014880 [Rubidibacter lacunae KORDI 51-2]